MPRYERSEFDIHQTSAPGSQSSLDELCGRKHTDIKGKHSSKFSAKWFGKKEVEKDSGQINVSKSSEEVRNGEDVTVKESEAIEIDICPIDHVPDNDETDIDIYPIDQHESHTSNGFDSRDGSSGTEAETGHSETTALSDVKQFASNELFLKVLSGDMDVKIPNLAKIVRIFTSSTFTGDHLRCANLGN